MKVTSFDCPKFLILATSLSLPYLSLPSLKEQKNLKKEKEMIDHVRHVSPS